MLDLQQVESFRMVAQTHNFTRAAAQLGCSQSSVTLHIQSIGARVRSTFAGAAPVFKDGSAHRGRPAHAGLRREASGVGE